VSEQKQNRTLTLKEFEQEVTKFSRSQWPSSLLPAESLISSTPSTVYQQP